MAAPKTHVRAREIGESLLLRSLPGSTNRKRDYVPLAGLVAERIWKRWKVGPWQWRCKHVRWYLDVATADLSPRWRYKHWLVVKAMIAARGKLNDWEPRLRGPWMRPTGEWTRPVAKRRPFRLPRSA